MGHIHRTDCGTLLIIYISHQDGYPWYGPYVPQNVVHLNPQLPALWRKFPCAAGAGENRSVGWKSINGSLQYKNVLFRTIVLINEVLHGIVEPTAIEIHARLLIHLLHYNLLCFSSQVSGYASRTRGTEKIMSLTAGESSNSPGIDPLEHR